MKAMITVITTEEQERDYMKAKEEYQNRYNAAFHYIISQLYLYHKCDMSVKDVVTMFQFTLQSYNIKEFTSEDWDIICAIFAGYSWERL